jgi:hypothetical protein
MFFPSAKSTVCALLLVMAFLAPSASTKQSKRGKSIWNYDGGVFFATDGSLPNGACFRVSGEINAREFFNNLKRADDEHGTVFHRGTEDVSQFPQALDVSFAIRDHPCTPGLREIAPRTYLTREMMSHLQLFVYWKRGMDLRAVKDVQEVEARVERITPFAKELAAELPQRFEWSYQLAVPSAGVPLTDSLVFVFRTAEGRIAARVAARL